jgi:hypothetical protein
MRNEALIPWLRRIIAGNLPVDAEIARLRQELEWANARADKAERDLESARNQWGYQRLTERVQMTEHDLKVWPEFWSALESGDKTFELRFDDRGFCAGDILLLREWSKQTGYSGRELRKQVTYLLAGKPWLADNYVCMGLRKESK